MAVDASGAVHDPRIVIGAIAPAPLRATEAERLLEGNELSPDVIEEAAQVGAKIVRPQDNADLGSRYRKWMASVYIGRALQDLAESR